MTIPANVTAAATDLGSQGWFRVGMIDDLPMMEGRRTTIDGRRVAVFRLQDGLAAIDATCPHKGGPLQDGLVADSCVTCPLHDRRINLITGEMIGSAGAVAVHEVHVAGEDVWVRLAAHAAADSDDAEDSELEPAGVAQAA
jgi:nitrite reductase (NADH) small subunit